MEFKRSLINKNYIFTFISVALCFVLGYILLISIDEVPMSEITIKLLFESVYTVFTQFGMLIFPIIIIMSFNIDYKEKNILFYELLDISEIKYFLSKLLVSVFLYTLSIFIMNTVVCLYYKDFSDFFIMFLHYESVILCFITIVSVLSFLFNNLIAVFCLNLFLWIGSIVLSTAIPKLSLLSYYDASNKLYENIHKYIETSNTKYLSLGESFFYDLVVLFLGINIIMIFKKRWKKNGI